MHSMTPQVQPIFVIECLPSRVSCVYWLEIERKSNPKASFSWISSFSPIFHFRNALNDPSGETYFLCRISTLARILCVLIRNREKIEAKSMSTHGFSHFNRFFILEMHSMTPQVQRIFYEECLPSRVSCVYWLEIETKSKPKVSFSRI
jgi:hypothetical protein